MAASSSSSESSSSSKQTQRSSVAAEASLPSKLPSVVEYQPPNSYSDVVPILFDLETSGEEELPSTYISGAGMRDAQHHGALQHVEK